MRSVSSKIKANVKQVYYRYIQGNGLIMKKRSTASAVGLTIAACFVILLFYTIGGAMISIRKIEGANANLVRGVCVWLSVAALLIFMEIKGKKPAEMGIVKPKAEGLKKVYYVIPMMIIALMGLIGGLSPEADVSYVLSTLFLSIAVGFSEELYFRSVVLDIWQFKGVKTAVIVSSVVFGICHLTNVLGGAGIAATLLQIAFAFLYGIAQALIFTKAKSLVPCIFVHFLHDFIAFNTSDVIQILTIVIAAVQVVILLVYVIMLTRGESAVGNEEKEPEEQID